MHGPMPSHRGMALFNHLVGDGLKRAGGKASRSQLLATEFAAREIETFGNVSSSFNKGSSGTSIVVLALWGCLLFSSIQRTDGLAIAWVRPLLLDESTPCLHRSGRGAASADLGSQISLETSEVLECLEVVEAVKALDSAYSFTSRLAPGSLPKGPRDGEGRGHSGRRVAMACARSNYPYGLLWFAQAGRSYEVEQEGCANCSQSWGLSSRAYSAQRPEDIMCRGSSVPAICMHPRRSHGAMVGLFCGRSAAGGPSLAPCKGIVQPLLQAIAHRSGSQSSKADSCLPQGRRDYPFVHHWSIIRADQLSRSLDTLSTLRACIQEGAAELIWNSLSLSRQHELQIFVSRYRTVWLSPPSLPARQWWA